MAMDPTMMGGATGGAPGGAGSPMPPMPPPSPGGSAMPMPLPPITRKRRKGGKHKLTKRKTRKKG